MDAERALSIGLGLKASDWKILVRTGWVLFVTFHIARSAGWLVYLGVVSPFASAADVDKLLRASEASARIAMQAELRVQTRVWCTNPDQEVREVAYRRIDQLRTDLHEISNISTPEPRCEKGTT